MKGNQDPQQAWSLPLKILRLAWAVARQCFAHTGFLEKSRTQLACSVDDRHNRCLHQGPGHSSAVSLQQGTEHLKQQAWCPVQVLLGHSSATSLQQGTEVVQQLLAQPPQALAQRCLHLKPEALNPEQRAGQQACRQLLELVRSSADVQEVRAALPEVDLAQFTGEGGETLAQAGWT